MVPNVLATISMNDVSCLRLVGSAVQVGSEQRPPLTLRYEDILYVR